MRNYKAKSVNDYISGSAPESQPTMRELRRIIKTTVPGAKEGISWGVPFYKYYGMLGGFSVFKAHVSFGLAFAFDEKVRKALEAKGYKTGSKTVQIRFDQKVPAAIVKKIVRAKAKENEAKRAKKSIAP